MRGSIMNLAMEGYRVLLPISWIVLVVIVIVLLPMCLFKRSRPFAGFGFIAASYLFGITTWLLGAVITFGSFGWVGLLIGLLLFGIGVVPLALIAAIFLLKTWTVAAWIVVMAAVTWGARLAGHWALLEAEK